MPYTKILPDVDIPTNTPRKKRFFLQKLSYFLLLFEDIKAVGSFLDNKRVIVVAAPHQSFKDEYLMILMILFKRFGAIPVDRKEGSGQYDLVINELKKIDNFLLIVTPEGRFDAERFRSSFVYLAKELEAEVMPVQIDYENRQLKFLPSFDMAGTKDEIIKRMRLKFDGIRGKKKIFRA
jgi:1-acyl-sn-glycerol-3-phosphate acyltransferase